MPASRKEELKRRVDRLLAGGRNTRDLDALFMWLRERSYGNRTVADVGDFVAHSDERDEGLAWRGVQGFFNIMDFMLPRIDHKAETKGPLPGTLDQFKAAVWSTFETIPAEKARQSFGVGHSKAKSALRSGLAALLFLEGEVLVPRRALTELEERLIGQLSSVISAQPAFTDTKLVFELFTCLVKNGLLVRRPSNPPLHFTALVALYAVERMHLARVLLKDGRVATLRAGTDAKNSEAHYSGARHSAVLA